jgi:adenylate cyclase
MTVLFSDIRGFTPIAEQMDPAELTHFLNEYLTAMTGVVFEHQGVLDKYMGDGIMAFWGAPKDQPNHAELACQTGFQMVKRLGDLQQAWLAGGLPPLNIGVGINTGPMTVGNVGSSVRFDYTVMGDAVNLASRLEGVNKEYGTSVIVSESTLEHVQGTFASRYLDLITVQGKKEPTAIYELLAPLDSPNDAPPAPFLEAWARAISLYQAQEFAKAKLAFQEVLEFRPDDPPSLVYLARCDAMAESPPGPEWDGVYAMTHK